MAKCGCGGSGCDCKIVGGGGVTVTGAGTPTNPYIITSGSSTFQIIDTATLNLTLLGSGTTGDPYTLSGDMAPISMASLSNVAVTAPTNGQVLIWNSTTQKWTPGPAATATPGLITVGSGLSGDGSSGNALNFKPLAGGRLVNTASGADVSTDTYNRLNNSFSNTAARTAAIPSPGSGMSAFMVDTGTPVMYDGSAWRPFWLEVGRSWIFPRVSANDGDSYTGTITVATGTITSAMPGRYRYDLCSLIQNSAGFANGASVLKLNGTVIHNIARDAYGPFIPVINLGIHAWVGGTMTLVWEHVNNGTTNTIRRDGTQMVITYLGRV